MIDLLNKINNSGIFVDVIDGELKLYSESSEIDEGVLLEIKEKKKELIQFLKTNGSTVNTEIPKLENSKSYELSSAQYRLWILSQLYEGSKAYNVSSFMEINEDIDVHIFKKAIELVVNRHESLRTVFRESEGGSIRQFIKNIKKNNLKLDFYDFRLDELAQIKVDDLIKKDQSITFDLAQGPLLRAKLFQLHERKYVFYFSMHHIITDGTSMDVFGNEIVSIYQAYIAGKNPDLTPLTIQYKDYSAWQKKQILKMVESKLYWKNKLSGNIPTLDLLGYQRRPRVKTYNGDRVLFSIKEVQVQKWKKKCKEYGTTLFMGLLAGLNAILYRYTNQRDIVVGTAVAGRNHKALTNQIGFYVNTLPLRVKINPDSSCKDLLLKVKKTVLESFEHQKYPFDTIVEDVQIKKDLSRNPIFDSMLVLQSNKKHEITKQGINVLKKEYNSNTSKFDVSYIFTLEADGSYGLKIEYNTDIYEKIFINQLGSHYITIMDMMFSNMNNTINEIQYISEKEKEKLLHGFNDTKITYY